MERSARLRVTQPGAGQSTHRWCVLNAASVPQSVLTAVDFQRSGLTQVLLEDFAVVTYLSHDLDDPVLRQFQLRTVITVSTQQTSDVQVLGRLGFGFDVFRRHASFFGVQQCIANPANNGGPLFVTTCDDRAQWFFGDGFRQNDVVFRRSQLGALCVELRFVGGQYVATTRFQRLGAFVGGVEGDRRVLQVVGAEVVGHVQLGSGTGLNADGRAVQFLGTFSPPLAVGPEANAVVISDGTKEHQTHARVAGAGPGGVTRQDVDLARLQRGETLFGVQLAEFDFLGVAEHGSRYSATEVGVDTLDGAAFVRHRETWQTVTHAALDEALRLDGVQFGARLSETGDTERCCGGHYSQGGFQHLHSNLQFALCCVGALVPSHPCEALMTRAGLFLGHAT